LHEENFMKNPVRTLAAGMAVFLVVGWFLTAGNRGVAEDKGGVREAVDKVADALAKGDSAQASSMASDIAKSNELEDVMNLMGLRKPTSKKPVFGVGDAPGAISPDGIEAKIIAMARKAPTGAQLNKESVALVQMGNRVAAIALIAKAKVPEKDEGQKKKKDWMEWSSDLEKAAKDFTEAAKEKKGAEVKAAASKLNSACSSCHGVFRD
jgi:hypothetical protein